MTYEARRAVRWGAGAAGFYLLVSLWSLAPILADPFEATPIPISIRENAFYGIIQQDQKLTAATIALNAHILITSPLQFWEGPQCYPARRAATLGEHMLGAGLRAVVPALFTDSPALLYNFVLLFDRWFAAVAMCALVFGLTRSLPAALVGGLLFGLHPFRTEDVAHPYVVANYWTALALLFAYRMMRDARWGDALGLTGCVALQVIEGAYPLLALSVFGGAFGLCLAIENRARLVALLPKILFFACMSGSVVAWVLHAYAQTRAEWETPATGFSALHQLAVFAPGHSTFPGFVLSALFLLGVFTRPRQLERDPRLPFLVAGAVAVLWALGPVRLPVLGVEIPSLFLMARRFIGFLELIRVPAASISAVYISFAVLAALGMHKLTAGRAPWSQTVWTIGVTSAVLVELWWPSVASLSFGYPLQPSVFSIAPTPEDRDLYRKATSGPLLDLPNPDRESGAWLLTGDFVLGGAYHKQLMGACYNSHSLVLQHDLAAISARIPAEPEALEQLYALGFRNLIVHVDRSPPALLDPLPEPARLVGRTSSLILYHVESQREVLDSLDLLELEPIEVLSQVEVPAGGQHTIEFAFRNAGPAVFRHPDPIVPSNVVVRWIDPRGAAVAVEQLRMLLPIALAPQGRWARAGVVRVPDAVGTYRVELALAGDPERALSRISVWLGPPPVVGAAALATDPKALESSGRGS